MASNLDLLVSVERRALRLRSLRLEVLRELGDVSPMKKEDRKLARASLRTRRAMHCAAALRRWKSRAKGRRDLRLRLEEWRLRKGLERFRDLVRRRCKHENANEMHRLLRLRSAFSSFSEKKVSQKLDPVLKYAQRRGLIIGPVASRRLVAKLASSERRNRIKRFFRLWVYSLSRRPQLKLALRRWQSFKKTNNSKYSLADKHFVFQSLKRGLHRFKKKKKWLIFPPKKMMIPLKTYTEARLFLRILQTRLNVKHYRSAKQAIACKSLLRHWHSYARHRKQVHIHILAFYKKHAFMRLVSALREKNKNKYLQKHANAWHLAFLVIRRYIPRWRQMLRKKRAKKRIALISIAAHHLISTRFAIFRLRAYAVSRRRSRLSTLKQPSIEVLEKFATRQAKIRIFQQLHTFAHAMISQRDRRLQLISALRAFESYARSRWAARTGRQLARHRHNRRLLRTILLNWRALIEQPRAIHLLPRPLLPSSSAGGPLH